MPDRRTEAGPFSTFGQPSGGLRAALRAPGRYR